MRRKVLLSRAIACCLLILFVTAASADAVDTYLRAEMANQRLPGLAVAVLRDGKPVSVRTLGLANIELNAPVKSEQAQMLTPMTLTDGSATYMAWAGGWTMFAVIVASITGVTAGISCRVQPLR